MYISLEKIKINNYRKIDNYSVYFDGNWSVITGINSSGKSSIIQALTFLSWFKAPEFFDIRKNITSIYDEEEEYLGFQTKIKLKLQKKIENLFNNSQFKTNLLNFYQQELENKENKFKSKNVLELKKDNYYNILQNIIKLLETDKSLNYYIKEGYNNALNFEFKKYPNFKSYNILFNSNGKPKSFEYIFQAIEYIEIYYDLPINEEPIFRFNFLDKNNNILIDNKVFSHIINSCKAIDHVMSFVNAFASTYIKGVISGRDYTESSNNQIDDYPQPYSYLKRDGSNITQYIKHHAFSNPEKLEKIKNWFVKIFGIPINIIDTLANDKTNVQVRIGTDSETTLPKIADGMHRVLQILIQLADSSGGILLIDEIEQHLHPSACKMLRKILYDSKDNTQIICTTHSPIFLDIQYIDNVILNNFVRDQIIPKHLNKNEINEALEVLGSSGSDVLFYDMVIFVEGDSDIIYLDQIINEIIPKEYPHEIYLLNKIGIHHTGGKTNMFLIKPEKVMKINRKVLFIWDSDLKEKTTPKEKEFIKNCMENKLLYHKWKRKEIENYIPNESIEEAFGLPSGSISNEKDISVLNYVKEILRRKNIKGLTKCDNKREFAKKVRDYITYEHICHNISLKEELENLIKKIMQLNTIQE